jgi:hypothetical protein
MQKSGRRWSESNAWFHDFNSKSTCGPTIVASRRKWQVDSTPRSVSDGIGCWLLASAIGY